MKAVCKLIKKFVKREKSFFGLILVFGLFLLLAVPVSLAQNITSNPEESITDASPSASIINAQDSILAVDPDEKPTLEEEMDYSLDSSGKFFAARLIVKFKAGVSDDVKRGLARVNNAKYIREDLDLMGAKVLKVQESERNNVFE